MVRADAASHPTTGGLPLEGAGMFQSGAANSLTHLAGGPSTVVDSETERYNFSPLIRGKWSMNSNIPAWRPLYAYLGALLDQTEMAAFVRLKILS